MSTTTEPSTAELAAEVAQLRYELDALRDELFQMSTEVRTHRLVIDDHEGNELAVMDAEEVRTHRLVVVDEHGAERISTTCDNDRTMLRLGIDDVNDDLGVGHQTDATVFIEAELDRTGSFDGRPYALAQVQCTTGDDAFAILEQRSIVEGHRGRLAVTNRGELHLHQQRWEGCYKDGAMNTLPLSIVEVGPAGVIERDVAGDAIAFAPMQRLVK